MSRDLTGQKFSRWTVLSKATKRKKHEYWLCICECGTKKEVRHHHLLSGGSKSCGCYRDEKAKKQEPTHGHTVNSKKSPEYIAWHNMIRRCNDYRVNEYKHYGARGIKVCDSWMSFENFITDMGDRPTTKHTLERIDNNGDYEPSNCEWVTMNVQARNKRLSSRSTTGITGVNWKSRIGKYHARIGHMDKQIHLGTFDTLEQAKEARKQAELKYWGKSSL